MSPPDCRILLAMKTMNTLNKPGRKPTGKVTVQIRLPESVAMTACLEIRRCLCTDGFGSVKSFPELIKKRLSIADREGFDLRESGIRKKYSGRSATPGQQRPVDKICYFTDRTLEPVGVEECTAAGTRLTLINSSWSPDKPEAGNLLTVAARSPSFCFTSCSSFNCCCAA